MIRPVVNSLSSGDMGTLIAGVAVFAGAAALFRLESLRETLAIVRKLWHKTC